MYDHLGPNPTLDNIKDALLDFKNKHYTIKRNTFDNKTEIFLIQFLQDKHPSLFNRLMRKDPLNRLIAPA